MVCPCCRNGGYYLKDKELLFRQSVWHLATSASLAGTRATVQSSEASPVWQSWLTPAACVVTTTNLAGGTSNKDNEYCVAVWNAPGAGQLWSEGHCLHLLQGCSSATSKCCHVMKGKAAGHLQPLISVWHMLHNSPASLFCTSPSSLLHCLSLHLFVLTYPSGSALFQLSIEYHPELRFTKLFYYSLLLITFPFYTSLHATYSAAVSLLSWPYLSAVLAWATHRQTWSCSSHCL